MSNEESLMNHVLSLLRSVAQRGSVLLTEIEMLSMASERNAELRIALYRQCTKMLVELKGNLRIHLISLSDRVLRNDISRMVGVLSDEAQEALNNQNATYFLHATLWSMEDANRDDPYRIEKIIAFIESKLMEAPLCPECGHDMMSAEDMYTCSGCGLSRTHTYCSHCKTLLPPR